MVRGLIGAGLGLSLGSTLIGSLPANVATPGIQQGFASGASFIPIGVNIHGAGLVIRKLKELKK